MKKQLAVMLLSLVSAMASAQTLDAAGGGSDKAEVTFSKGTEGWVGWGGNGGGSWISSTPGKHGAAYYTYAIETFGIDWVNKDNKSFVFDYTRARKLTIGLDIKVNSITYLGHEVARDLVVELRDYDKPHKGMPYTSVWYNLGTISAGQPGWRHMEVTIDDTRSRTLPSGWGGYGNSRNEPSLPPGRSFADVLANTDELVLTTYVPGMMYGWTNYDVVVDNLSIKSHGRR